MYSLKTNPKLRTYLIIIAVILIISVGFVIYVRHEMAPYWAKNTRFNMGGYSLYLDRQGEGNPPVIFVSAHNSPAWYWEGLPEEVAKHTSTIVYDRAGLGESDDCPGERTAEVIAKELNSLLDKADIEGPFVLVGHSAGGLYIRMFAAMYPEKVAGMVLLDASHEDQIMRSMQDMTADEIAQYQDDLRIMDVESKEMYGSDYRETWTDLLKSFDQVRETRGKIKEIPLTVIVAGLSVDNSPNGLWLELQQDIASLSSKSKIIVEPGSEHTSIHIDSFSVVAEQIIEMVNSVRK